MSSPFPPPIPEEPKKKSACLPVGIGCLVLLLLGLAGAGMGVKFLWNKGVDFMEKSGVSLDELKANPERAAAKLFIAANPDIVLVSEDKTAETMTIKVKSSGQEMTVSWKDLAKGKFVITDSAGGVVVETKDDGSVVMKGPKGTTTIGAGPDVSQPPSWVPLHPSMKLMQGGMKNELGDEVKGTCLAESTEPLSVLKKFYTEELKGSGTRVNSGSTDNDDGALMTAQLSDKKQTLTLIFSKGESGNSTVMIHYGGKK